MASFFLEIRLAGDILNGLCVRENAGFGALDRYGLSIPRHSDTTIFAELGTARPAPHDR